MYWVPKIQLLISKSRLPLKIEFSSEFYWIKEIRLTKCDIYDLAFLFFLSHFKAFQILFRISNTKNCVYVYLFSRDFCIIGSWEVGKLKKIICISKCWQNHYKIGNLCICGKPWDFYSTCTADIFWCFHFKAIDRSLKSIFIKLSIH